MEKYIDFNTGKRANADNSFEKYFFKLMISSVYGKTMEHLQKGIDVRLVNNKKDFLKYTSRPTHITHKIFDKSDAAFHEIKRVLTLNKAIYVGFTVLELRKWLMYDFHYKFIKNILMLNFYLLYFCLLQILLGPFLNTLSKILFIGNTFGSPCTGLAEKQV